MDSLVFFLNFLVTMFSVLDPFGCAVALLALTPGLAGEHRAEQAQRAVKAAAVVLVVFALLGGAIFAVFGISIQALMVAGGLILVQVSFKMLAGESLAYRRSKPEMREAETKEDIAIIPMAVPMLAGPAAITTVMVFANRASGFADWVMLFASLGLVLYLTHVILQRSEMIANWLGDIGLRVLTRLMGLILIAMGAEFVLSGLKGYFE